VRQIDGLRKPRRSWKRRSETCSVLVFHILTFSNKDDTHLEWLFALQFGAFWWFLILLGVLIPAYSAVGTSVLDSTRVEMLNMK